MTYIYLDNNATTQPAPAVVDAMHEMLADHWANPSSVHRLGQMARQRVELARASVAQLLGCRDRDIIFTSGGTESNNLALHGSEFEVLITTAIEHSAVREPAQALDQPPLYLPTNIDGLIDPASLRDALAKLAGKKVMVSIQWANNETGVIQPIELLASIAREHGAIFHTDATQVVGKLPVNMQAAGVDMATVSAHKFHGPKGVGALYVARGVSIKSQHQGGPQERDRRGGTENTAAIVGMGVASELAESFLKDPALAENIAKRRDRFEKSLLEAVPDAQINGQRSPGTPGSPGTPRLWNTTNIGFSRLEAEAILLALSEKGVCASAGAACSSGSLDPSPVLRAMGIPDEIAHGSVRFSLSRDTTDDHIDRALSIIPQIIQRLKQTLPSAR